MNSMTEPIKQQIEKGLKEMRETGAQLVQMLVMLEEIQHSGMEATQRNKTVFAGVSQVLDPISALLKHIKEITPEALYTDYADFFSEFGEFVKKCVSREFLEENMEMLFSSIRLFDECLCALLNDFDQRVRKCDCFKYYHVFQRTETGDYICPICGSTEKDRRVTEWLRGIDTELAADETRVLFISPPRSIEIWMEYHAPQIILERMDKDSGIIHTQTGDKNVAAVEDGIYELILSFAPLSVGVENPFPDELERLVSEKGGIVLWPGEDPEIYVRSADVTLSLADRQEIDEDLCENGPLVSVILPCYNHEKYVAMAIESVLQQSYKNIEFLIADDASTDGTPEVIRRYEKYYSKVYYLKENTSCRISRQLAAEATGKYIALMHSDDMWEKDKLALQIAYMEAHENCGVCLTWANYVDENGERIEEIPIFTKGNRSREKWIQYFWKYGNTLCNPSMLARREVFEKWQRPGYLHGRTSRQLPDMFKWIDTVQDTDIYIVPRSLIKMHRHWEGGDANVSALSPKNNYRSHLEAANIWPAVLRDMDHRFFLTAFRDMLVNKEASSPEEAMCEKYFLMLKHRNLVMQNNAFIYFQNIYRDETYYTCMKEEYHYTIKDFHRDETEKGFCMIDILQHEEQTN